MATPPGFWSYVHADDQAESGRIVRLGRDVQGQYELLTGESVDLLFLDKDAIAWGDDWQRKIDEAIQGLAFFIPILTPRYFLSAACRNELQSFARSAAQLGVRELVLPIVYVEFAGLRDESPVDDAVRLVKTYQWADWRSLRFVDTDKAEYRQAVAGLASRLVDVNRQAETSALRSTVPEVSTGGPLADEGPGLLDYLETAMNTMPALTETVQEIGREIQRVGEIVDEANDTLGRESVPAGQELASRLLFSRRLARDLQEPAEHLMTLGNAYAAQLHEVDGAVRAIIGFAPYVGNEQAATVFTSIRSASVSARQGVDMLQGLAEKIRPIEAMSRDLRVPFRLIRQGLTAMVEAGSITDDWIRLLDEGEGRDLIS